jgi:alkanesulfonate monooxygenase SsuD/methylene tetrahydromethanopterin reductase-like flavin-dependent oxidoreductase (luciferase family)
VSRPLRQTIAFIFVAIVSVAAAGLSVSTKKDVERIEPQVTEVVQATAACKASILDDAKHLAACARRIEVGLSTCARDYDCRAAFLALMRSATRKGVVPGGNQNPSGLAPGQGKPSGPETQPSPGSPGPEAETPAAGSGTVVDGTKEAVHETVEGTVDEAGHLVEDLCTLTRHLQHLC